MKNSLKNIFIKILPIIPGLLVVFILVFFYTIKTKTRTLNKYEPFNEIIGKTLTLNEKVYLFEDVSGFSPEKKEDYPYRIINEADRNSQSLSNLFDPDPPYYKIIDSLEEGTLLHFNKAKIFTNGVSGGSNIYMYITLNYKGKETKVLYKWGEESMSKRFDKEEKTWSFKQAPWQHHEDTSFYKIPYGIW